MNLPLQEVGALNFSSTRAAPTGVWSNSQKETARLAEQQFRIVLIET